MLKEINKGMVLLCDIISIKNDLIDEIMVFYALEQQFKVVALSRTGYFCNKCKQAEYDFHLSIISKISVSDDIKLGLIMQKQEVKDCMDYSYLKEKLNYFRQLNTLKRSSISNMLSEQKKELKYCQNCKSTNNSDL